MIEISDPLVKALVVAVVVGAAMAAGLLSRMGTAVRRRRVEVDGPPGPTLFVSADCETCRRAREVLAAVVGTSGFHELSYSDSPELFSRLSIHRVPTLLVVAADGAWKVEGVPTAKRLGRWLSASGLPPVAGERLDGP